MGNQTHEPGYTRYAVEPSTIGWQDDGTIVRLVTNTDKVGIGITNPGEKLTVAGSISSGGLIYDGITNSSNWGSVYQTVFNLSAYWSELLTTRQICPPSKCTVIEAPMDWTDKTDLTEGWTLTIDWSGAGMQTAILSGDQTDSQIQGGTHKTTSLSVYNTGAGMTVSVRLSAAGDPTKFACLDVPNTWRWVGAGSDFLYGGSIAILTLGMYVDDEIVASLAVEY